MQNTFITSLQDTIVNNSLLAGVVGLVVILTSIVVYLVLRVRALTKGSSGRSLENIIVDNKKRIADLEEHCLKEAKKVSTIDARLKTSVRGIALERFDPFQQQGGQQSFSSAFVNEHGDGVIISGLHSRDGVRVYAKPVEGGVSKIELSEEENRALKAAQRKTT